MSANTQLQLYNGALRILGQRKLASITEDAEPRHLLDDAWAEGAVDNCLEEGLWNFAMRTVAINYDPSVQPDFGFSRAFAKPTDWIKTAGAASDGYFSARLRDEEMKDEAGYWWADLDTIYIRYVSNDNLYGSNLAIWPNSFSDFMKAHLALQICPRLIKALNQRADIEKIYTKARLEARNKDAMNEGSPSFPPGRFVAARHGRRNSRFDRGNTGSLIG